MRTAPPKLQAAWARHVAAMNPSLVALVLYLCSLTAMGAVEAAGGGEGGGGHTGDLSLPLLFLAMSLVLGAIIKHAVKYFNIPIPYTVLLLLCGVVLGGLNEVEALGSVGRSMDQYASMDPHLLLTLFLPARPR